MNGLEIAKAYFETHGLPMLREQFADFLRLLAAGLFGGQTFLFGLFRCLGKRLLPGFALLPFGFFPFAVSLGNVRYITTAFS